MPGNLFLIGYYITEHSWLFFFNDGSGVDLQLAEQQWTRADFDWNTDKTSLQFWKTIYLDATKTKEEQWNHISLI